MTTFFEVELLDALPGHIFNSETLQVQYFSTDDLPEDMDKINPYWLEDALNRHGGPFVR